VIIACSSGPLQCDSALASTQRQAHQLWDKLRYDDVVDEMRLGWHSRFRFPSPAFQRSSVPAPHIQPFTPTVWLLSAHPFRPILPCTMRYIRFLKSPRVVTDKGTSRKQVHCLITITSDLGDSFLPYDIQLAAELLATADSEENVLVWSNAQWTAGMRSLPITFPLPKSQVSLTNLRVRVGGEPKRAHDEFLAISEPDARGVVSAWSPPFMSNVGAPKFVERRFKLPDGPVTTIWEETGESIARHLWYVTSICNVLVHRY
jgi:hypothetical protein